MNSIEPWKTMFVWYCLFYLFVTHLPIWRLHVRTHVATNFIIMLIEMRSINLPTISGKYRLQLFERGQLLVVCAIANSPNRKEKKNMPNFHLFHCNWCDKCETEKRFNTKSEHLFVVNVKSSFPSFRTHFAINSTGKRLAVRHFFTFTFSLSLLFPEHGQSFERAFICHRLQQRSKKHGRWYEDDLYSTVGKWILCIFCCWCISLSTPV